MFTTQREANRVDEVTLNSREECYVILPLGVCVGGVVRLVGIMVLR